MSEMNFGPLRLSVEDQVGVLELNDPARRNPVSPAMAAGLLDALDEIPALGLRCLVLTGAGSAFSAGGDLAAAVTHLEAQAKGTRPPRDYSLGAHHHPILRRFRELACPFVTAVNGPAAGLGLGYALMGDLIVAARRATFVASFVKVGMSPDAGVSWLLPRLIGNARAREMMMLGAPVSAEQALAWGMINRVFDDDAFLAETRALARRLAQGPSLALEAIRKLSWKSWDASHEDQIDAEERTQLHVARSSDAEEGMRSFLEKRPPNFKGW